MNKRFARPIVAAVAVIGFGLVAVPSASGQPDDSRARAQRAEQASVAPAPRTADGRADFSGIWGADRISSMTSTMR